MINHKMHIAILDNGVSERLVNIKLYRNLEVTKNGTLISLQDLSSDKNHGTICLRIFEEYVVDDDILVSSIKILDEKQIGNYQQVVSALEWCYKNRVDIVNMSLGSNFIRDKKKILNTINYFTHHDMVIVASASNNGYLSYPASFTNVIGVRSSDDLNIGEGNWNYLEGSYDGIEIETYFNHKVKWNDGSYDIYTDSNSYAAPMITARLIEPLRKHKPENNNKTEYLKLWLYNNSKNKSNHYKKLYTRPDWIQKGLCVSFSRDIPIKDIPYIFNCKIIYVEKIIQISKWLFSHRKEEFDTIIIYNLNTFSMKEIFKLKKILCYWDINIIFLDKFNEKFNILLNNNGKKWKKVFYLNKYCKYIPRKAICPIIIIYAKGVLLLKSLKYIEFYFMKKGYSTRIVTTNMSGSLCGFQYVEEDIFQDLENLFYVSNIEKSDLIIFGIEKYQELIEEKVDIVVTINLNEGKYNTILKSEKNFVTNERVDLDSLLRYICILLFNQLT